MPNFNDAEITAIYVSHKASPRVQDDAPNAPTSGDAYDVTLEMVAFTAQAGAHLTLQLLATTTAYAQPRLGGTVTFSSVHVELPTVTGVTRSCCVGS